MEIIAKVLEGIFDMIGPRTFDGGYSPSQVMSSAMKSEVDVVCSSIFGAKDTWLTRVAVWAAGTNAEEIATMAARRRRLNLAILKCIFYISTCRVSKRKFCVRTQVIHKTNIIISTTKPASVNASRMGNYIQSREQWMTLQ